MTCARLRFSSVEEFRVWTVRQYTFTSWVPRKLNHHELSVEPFSSRWFKLNIKKQCHSCTVTATTDATSKCKCNQSVTSCWLLVNLFATAPIDVDYQQRTQYLCFCYLFLFHSTARSVRAGYESGTSVSNYPMDTVYIIELTNFTLHAWHFWDSSVNSLIYICSE